MNTWVIIVLAWLVVGLLCYAVILRFFPPKPLLVRSQRIRVVGKGMPRRFSIRDLPQIVISVIPIAALSPFLLLVLVCYKLGKPTSTGSK
jgi:hypothetical protein